MEVNNDTTQRISNIVYPTGKLTAVTRKRNEITQLIGSSVKPTVQQVKRLQEELLQKISNFDEACKEILQSNETTPQMDAAKQWYRKHIEDANSSLAIIETWLLDAETEIEAKDSVSQTSSKTRKTSSSRNSNRSQSSSLRTQLAIKRAQRKADDSVLLEQRSLEDAQRSQARQMQDLERQRNLRFEKNLESELDAMDEIGTRSDTNRVRSSQTGMKSILRQIDQVGPVRNPYFDDCLPKSLPEENTIHSQVSQQKTKPGYLSNNDQLADVLNKQNEISLLLLKNQDKINLPKHEPETFDGTDLTKYASFIQCFDRTIENKCENNLDRIFYLEKYTSGLPLQLVKSCRNKDPTAGYQKAREALDREFGNEFRISNAYIQRIEKWDSIRAEDGTKLQEFSIFLYGCCNLMDNENMLNQLNSPTEIKKIVFKLPYKMRDGWRRYVLKLQESRLAKFRDLCDFIRRESDLINQPMYGDIADPKADKIITKTATTKTGKKIFSTTIEETKKENKTKSCEICKKSNHQLINCFFFKKRSHQDKIAYLRDNKLCFACFESDHMAQQCKKRAKCKDCGRTHPTALHRSSNETKEQPISSSSTSSAIGAAAAVVEDPNKKNDEMISMATKAAPGNYSTGAGATRTISPAIPVKITVPGSNKEVITYMGMDAYCSDVFMSEDLLHELGIKGQSANITLTTMHHSRSKTKTKVINNLLISDLDENQKVLIPVVFTRKQWPFTVEDSPTIKDLDSHPHLAGIPFRFIDARIGLLVGVSQPNILKVLKTVEGPRDNDPFATLHKFGWALNGPVTSTTTSPTHHCHRVKVDSLRELDEDFKRLCAKEFVDESVGLMTPSVDDQKWERKVKSSIRKLSDGHYEVGLPFRDDDIHFPCNREQVLRRLISSRRRLKINADFYEEYKNFMNLMLTNKFAERVPSEQLKTLPGKAWYLFHFGIYHKQKKTIRIVFDASLKYKGVSLNDTLLQGPDLTSGLLGVLLRFRQEPIGIMADIRKMFYMVSVPSQHRDFLRFFWYPDGDLDQQPVEYRVSVHIFGAVSSPSIANYVLRYTATVPEADKFGEDTRVAISRDFYVDDLVKSVKTEEAAMVLVKEIRELLATSGFDLIGFISNSRMVLSSIPTELLSKTFKDLDLSFDDLPYERALGVTWNVGEDSIGFKLKLPSKANTKRGVLSTVFSLYDPLGIAGPVVLPAKKIFQKTCHENLDWDDALPRDLLRDWNIWKQNINLMEDYKILRCLKLNDGKKSIQLHLFCDGSETAYAAVAYLRCESEQDVDCAMIMAKTRLVPLKGGASMTTIPRIELNGAKLAIIVQQIVKNELELPLDKTVFWTDSTTVLNYINSETKRFQRFVGNRVTFIRNHSQPDHWRHVPGVLNPADIASRGASVGEFLRADQWKFGPDFLKLSEEDWPDRLRKEVLDEEDPELKKQKIILSTKIDEQSPTDKLLRISSSWYKTLMNVVWFLRFKHGLRSSIWKTNPVQLHEIKEAKLSIWKYIQYQKYSAIIQRLTAGVALLKKDHLTKLNPYLDDRGLLRVGGRICRSMAPYDVKFPIILPGDHHVVKLLIEQVHVEVGHLGRETILAQLRKSYWIVGANASTRRILRHCVFCKKIQGKANTPIMADLPEERLQSDLPVFFNMGVDCFGPFMVKRGRTREKRYGIIFTCLATRAVHIEILFTLETASFISALRRFAARRGYPGSIRSDNGTNFVGAEKELRESVNQFNDQHLKKFMLQKNIEWKFHPPAASHFGGIWEREIRTIRKVLSGLTNEQPMHLNDENLSTLMCEVESILNNRPLTAVSSDPGDLEALTPNHLLLARSGVTFPPGLFTKDDLYEKRRWRQIQYLANLFWTRWRREYIPLLQERQKWTTRSSSYQVGDLVLVVDQLLPRNLWSLGRIVKVYGDCKGEVRFADVKIARVRGELKPGFQTVILQRPIVKLVLLKSVSDL